LRASLDGQDEDTDNEDEEDTDNEDDEDNN
jgi:hypothetical protein